MAETAPVVAGNVGGDQQQQQQRASGWQLFRTFAFQMLIFYLITSYFRSGKQQTGPDGEPIIPAVNIFPPGQEMELSIFFSEDEEFEFSSLQHIWTVDLEYNNWEDGIHKDGSRYEDITINVPESVQDNGTWYIHILLVKNGYPIDPEDEEYDSDVLIHEVELFNRYKKVRVHNTANLLTGKAEVAPGEIKASDRPEGVESEIVSYWHPNITVNLVYDGSQFIPGQVPEPLNKYIQFNESGTGYYPVLYLNDYWNLAQEYMPLNNTMKNVSVHLTYTPLSFFRFQLYASMTRDNPWGKWMGAPNPNDEEQDTVKQTLLETNPYLLGLTIIVSIIHSVFEFLAFKNDVQFWRSRKSLEGLSVQSVFFNVFQSFIVLLYILDNETNFVVIISIFIGLLIELWKVTKVVDIRIDRNNLIGGVIPRIQFRDQPSYVQSSTKIYDKLAFKYLGCILFPLFIGYGAYSLLYHEHKGWYSFLLSMCYGFLLTFGFITMTPQLFINYKLKSVAHLPWRMLTYKALNTFIDDMFAFVIKMPTMYRIGCFRDDIVFFIYLYQRWIYRVDPKRVNEFGTTGEDHRTKQQVVQENKDETSDVKEPIESGTDSTSLLSECDDKSNSDKKND